MKWFKHMTKAHDDESLSIVVDRAGLEGYGFYWMVLEIIAAQMDETGVTSVQYPTKKWLKLWQIQPKKAKLLLELCEEVGLFSVKVCGNLTTIDCPKLLAVKDEHTTKKARNSGVTPERLRSDSGVTPEQEPEPEVEVEAPQTPQGEAGGGGDDFDLSRLIVAYPDLARLKPSEVRSALAGRNGSTARAVVILARACADPEIRHPAQVFRHRLADEVSPRDEAKARRALGIIDPQIVLSCSCGRIKKIRQGQTPGQCPNCGAAWAAKQEIGS